LLLVQVELDSLVVRHTATVREGGRPVQDGTGVGTQQRVVTTP
jgi:hypothetical protein